VQVTLTNIGERRGSEVVQLYVRDNVASMVRPVKELKAFQRVELAPNQAATLTFYVPVDMLNFTDRSGKRIVEPGEFTLMAGSSSAEIHGTVIANVSGATRELAKNWRMLSRCEVN
jgi:beta-glucosidase